jgi:hypothetical protein
MNLRIQENIFGDGSSNFGNSSTIHGIKFILNKS